ncbi:hypothetical protein RV134_270332 [Roseovarius sp. EC-HK134]|nr:hypothetical protein RV134_270332 [Roseovarius sp. EC-HK134]VVT16579.1 hypothetical protein RV420_330058 [Roseovarius sp. EC-SD190]
MKAFYLLHPETDGAAGTIPHPATVRKTVQTVSSGETNHEMAKFAKPERNLICPVF